jgi:glycosyltransferase involved in cell wall biosynthesis
LEELATPRGIVRFLPNGWPDEWADRRKGRRLVAGPYVFAMGRVVELKGFQTLVEAFCRVRQKHPHASLVIAGDGAYLPQLREQARRLGLEPTDRLPAAGDARPVVCLPGFIHGDAKLSLLQHAAVSVSPSIRQEPMSLVLFEMLCCGVPVLGSRVGGTPDIVRPGVNGELFSAGDAGELSARLDRLLSNPAERDRLASQAAFSVEAYRWSRIAPAYLALFADVIAARRGAAKLAA